MDNISRIQSLQGPESLYFQTKVNMLQLACRSTYLVNEILAMIIAEFLSSNDPVQICFHEFLNQIHLLKIVEARRPQDVEDGDNVLMTKVAQELNLSQRSQTEHRVVKRRNTLYRDLSLR